MNIIEEVPLKSKEMCCDKCTQRIKDKAEKLGFSEQLNAIQNEGFENPKKILKALKKNRGDILLSIQFLQTKANKESKKPKFEKMGGGKICKKRICKNNKEIDSEQLAKRQERKNERLSQRYAQKHEERIKDFPQFAQFNESMKNQGFSDEKKVFKALKKFEGDQEKAGSLLRHKKILETIELRQSFGKGEIRKIYLDCNNCFYLESSFLKKAVKGNFKEIEEKITTLMKIFQASYGSQIEIVLVFDNSKLMKDAASCSQFLSNDFKMVNARPQYATADDAIVYLASQEKINDQNAILYITSDRILQARLIEENAKNIIASKTFFRILKEQYVDSKSYSAIIDI